jgi:hypothetical protein
MTSESQFPSERRAYGPVLRPTSPAGSDPPSAARASRPAPKASWFPDIRVRRDAIFRKLLVIADVISAVSGLAVLAVVGGQGILLLRTLSNVAARRGL